LYTKKDSEPEIVCQPFSFLYYLLQLVIYFNICTYKILMYDKLINFLSKTML